jgi:hypothetical protein
MPGHQRCSCAGAFLLVCNCHFSHRCGGSSWYHSRHSDPVSACASGKLFSAIAAATSQHGRRSRHLAASTERIPSRMIHLLRYRILYIIIRRVFWYAIRCILAPPRYATYDTRGTRVVFVVQQCADSIATTTAAVQRHVCDKSTRSSAVSPAGAQQ